MKLLNKIPNSNFFIEVNHFKKVAGSKIEFTHTYSSRLLLKV